MVSITSFKSPIFYKGSLYELHFKVMLQLDVLFLVSWVRVSDTVFNHAAEIVCNFRGIRTPPPTISADTK